MPTSMEERFRQEFTPGTAVVEIVYPNGDRHGGNTEERIFTFIQSECRAAEERARREFAKALLNRIDEYRDRSYEANTILEAVRAELFVRKERLADSLEI